jgi:hypothetical protein
MRPKRPDQGHDTNRETMIFLGLQYALPETTWLSRGLSDSTNNGTDMSG